MFASALVRVCVTFALVVPAFMGSRCITTPKKEGSIPPDAVPAPMESGVTATASALDPSLAMEVHTAVDRSLDWFAATQRKDGSWSNTNFPALTALPLWAFANSDHPRRAEVVPKAVRFILSCVQEDGGIYCPVPGRKGGGLSNYNTAICMAALHAVGDTNLHPVVRSARSFVAESQHFGDDIYRGGMGYDRESNKSYTDLMNSVIAFESMRLTEDVEDGRDAGEKHVDLDWDAARKFLARMQNEAASGSEDEGGFPYRPDESKAGTATNESGAVYFRSYGSMTYAGLLAMMYADVRPDDPRAVSAFDWSKNHWTLEENPGMGDQGLYFFYHVMTKALDAYGRPQIVLKDGTKISWRAEVAKKVVSLQKIDRDGRGRWVNETSRFWEADPVLVTSYSVLALQAVANGK